MKLVVYRIVYRKWNNANISAKTRFRVISLLILFFDFTVSLSFATNPIVVNSYRRVVIYYYYLATGYISIPYELKAVGLHYSVPLSTETGFNKNSSLKTIQRAIAILKSYYNSDFTGSKQTTKSVEDGSILGLLYLYYSRFFTGATRAYYVSIGILLLNRGVFIQPYNLRLRFLRLLGFTRLPARFYSVQRFLNVDRKAFLFAIARLGRENVVKNLDYLYFEQWESLLYRKKDE